MEWIESQQCPVNKAITMISVIGTPMIQRIIERIMVSFMSWNKIIRLLPDQLLTWCPVKRHLASENACRFPQKSAMKLILASHLHSWPARRLLMRNFLLDSRPSPGWVRIDHEPIPDGG